jgi:hypothetical protein
VTGVKPVSPVIEMPHHNPRVGGSSPSAATSEQPRGTPQNPAPVKGLRQPEPETSGPGSRREPRESAPFRAPSATASATVSAADVTHEKPLTPDSDLTLVIDAWDRLPEAVRAGILAMVRASAPSGPLAPDRIDGIDKKSRRSRGGGR